MKRILLRLLVIFSLSLLFLVLCVFGFSLAVVSSCSRDLPDVNKLLVFEPSEATKIFSSDGRLIGILFKENRTWIPLWEIPKCMQQAILAIEDSRFYQHRGVDLHGIARAALADFKGRRLTQGASTITQQLARNIFLHPKATLHRKIQEALLAIQIERRFTKSEILELYLNQIYFGGGAYGIESAAQVYFGKKAKDLTLPEAAIIAGLPAAPSVYSPFCNPKMAKYRKILVLKRMAQLGYVTEREANEAIRTEPRLAKRNSEFSLLKYPYFTTYVVKMLSQKYSDDLLYRGGLRIYTTVDLRLQKIAEKALMDGIKRAKAEDCRCQTGALVALDPRNGFIKAMVGGLGYTPKNQFNRAWQALRQPGSSFKVFVYATAIDSGYTPDSPVADSPISFNMGDGVIWSPKNCDGGYRGMMTFREALKWSRNVCAVRVAAQLGIERVIDYAYRMGIKSRLESHLSVALGSGGVTPLDMASAFGVLGNGGIRVEPTAVKQILDSDGNVVEDNTWPHQEEVLPASTAFTMAEMLKCVIESGTGVRAQIGRPAAGKTGTTDEYRDAWFIGFTPQLSTAVWVGNDDNTQMNRVYGGDVPAPIWADFMKKALVREPVIAFGTVKENLVQVMMCAESKLRATGTCPKVNPKYYKPNEIPTKFCNIHGPLRVVARAERGKKGTGYATPAITPPAIAHPAIAPPGPVRPTSRSPAKPAGEEKPVFRPKAIEIPKGVAMPERARAIAIPPPPAERERTVIQIPHVPSEEAPPAEKPGGVDL